AAAAAALSASRTNAVTTVWVGPSGGSWITASNWTMGQPGSGDLARFPVGGVGVGVVLTNGRTANRLLFQRDYALTNPNLALHPGAISADSGTSSVIFSPLVVSGSLGTQGLTKFGAGTLELRGANTFTGGVTINAGTLVVNTDSRLGNSSNDVTINSGAVL